MVSLSRFAIRAIFDIVKIVSHLNRKMDDLSNHASRKFVFLVDFGENSIFRRKFEN
jgi:hypothetical protein